MCNFSFSIIIPVYNVAPYLRKSVDSVILQDFKDYEIILVDDGSTDGSSAICDEYAKRYTQVKVIHKINGGLSDARNFGIEQAQGNFLIFLDSDDFWNGVTILSEIDEMIRKENPDLIIHGSSAFYDLGKIVTRKFKNRDVQKLSFNFKDDLRKLVDNDIYYATACNKIIRTSIVKKNKIEFPKGKLHEDVAWCADIIPYIGSYALYPNPFYYYRKERQGSLTIKVKPKNIIDLIDILSQKEIFLSKYEGGLSYLSYNYNIYLSHINLLKKEQKQEYLEKLIRLRYLLDFYPKSILSFSGIVRLYFYKVFGIKYTGLIEYNIRKIFKK